MPTTDRKTSRGPTPVAAVAAVTAYSVPRAQTPIDLRLDGNEGAMPPADAIRDVLGNLDPQAVRIYPSTTTLEAAIAKKIGVPAAHVLVTAGGDDGLARACRAVLGPGRTMIMPVPTFEMFDKFARLTGADIATVPWLEPAYPVDAVLGAVDDRTAAIVVVSPNNPTGAIATADDLRRLSAGAPNALLIVDLAYIEFANDDTTRAALDLPNALVFRTLSKAWGLAGLRVGYAVGAEKFLDWLRAVGLPYAVSAPSIALALDRIERADAGEFIARVKSERAELAELLRGFGADVSPSEGNFVFARVRDSVWFRDAMAGLGIAIRAFPGKANLENAVRITCPGEAADFARLVAAIKTVFAPDGIAEFDAAHIADNQSAWFITGDEAGIRLARERRWLPIGILPSAAKSDAKLAGEITAKFIAAGAARVVADESEWKGLLPS